MCPSMSSSEPHAYERLQQIKMILANKGADFMAPCGKQNLDDCDLLKHIGAWNDVLAAIHVRLEELVETRELAVSFPVKVSGQREKRKRVERAVVLLYKLFVAHTCVARIVIDDLGEFCNPERFALLCHAISSCRRLTTLRVNADMDEASYYQKLLTGCASFHNLEELSFERMRDCDNTGNMAILATLLERNSRLSKFRVDGFSTSSRHTSTLLRELQRCQTLSHLSLDITSFGENEATLFLNMLKGNNVLKSLRLEGKQRCNHLTVSCIASALSKSTTLENLELLGFHLCTADVWALATGLGKIQTLQSLIIDHCTPVFSLPPMHTHVETCDSPEDVSSQIAPYIHIVEQIPGLQCFAFDLLRFSTEDQRAFLQVLGATAYPTRTFVDVRAPGYASELKRIALETGTANRIYWSPVCEERIDFPNLLTESRVGAVSLEVQRGTCDNEIPNVNERLSGMSTLDHVVSFHLEIRGSMIAPSTAQILARYLDSTKILEAVTLNFSTSKDSSMRLLDALSRNVSITRLGVERWCSTRRNFTIVSLRTQERRENAKNWAFIQNVATRNAALLEKAARFVAGDSSQKSDAEAFEAVASSPLLLRRVQVVKGVGKCEAVEMVRRAVWNLRDMDGFMTITGVVIKSVMCEESRDGRARLDSLPADCWLAIRQYLSVTDVAMATQDWGLWMHAKFLSSTCPYKFTSTEDAYEKLQQIKSILAEKGADFTGPCGKEDDRECHLLKHLSTWNDVMIPINVRITAMVTTKELELCFPKRSQCLSRLSLDATTFGAEEASSLLQFLSGKKGLKSLRLKSNGLNRSITVHSIASVLSNATDLVDLELDGFFIYTHDAWLLAMTLVQLQMVQNLALVQCIPIFSSLVDLTGFEANGSSASVSKRIEPYIHIVRGLTSLRSLALDLVRFPIEDQRAFLEALAGNNFLQHVTVAPPKRGYSSELSRMLIETGTANRICCGPVVTHETNWDNARVIP
ncbi:hypothetical protein HPB51_013218 [Rhipicephalus microplus]|uniref:Uncharacterized protein n=1 Tax=Rhipicephalus microplus TaxID=6941 RepID=A0A9J6DMW3_RHIMP|nr:hypothetical protein HPB51_013218 [Rhipicephalus microplus]